MDTDTLSLCKLSPPPRLPPEILTVIFNQLDHPEDLRSAMNTSREWSQVLEPRIGELLSLVLQVPHLLATLPLSTLLACRQTSHSVKATVDGMLQNHSKAHPDQYYNHNQRTKCEKISDEIEEKFYNFDSEEACIRFQEKMGHYKKKCDTSHSSASNPFILGCLQVDLIDKNNFSNYCEGLLKMFQNYGKYVLSLKVRFGRALASQVGILLTILENVPNLRHLEVSTAPSHYFFISWPFHFEEIYDWIQQLEMPHLVSLNVTRCRTCIGLSDVEHWEDWEYWKNKPRTVEGAVYAKFEKQLTVAHKTSTENSN